MIRIWNWLCDRPPPAATPPNLNRKPEVQAAIAKSEKAITEGHADLVEIRKRNERLDRIRRENHFAPKIFDAFKGN
jgi:hypothetical protein